MNLLKSNIGLSASGVVTRTHLKKLFPGNHSVFLQGNLDKFKSMFFRHGVEVAEIDCLKVIKCPFYSGQFGPRPGSQWRTNFEPVDSAFLEYKVFVPEDFIFVKGGKLPGLGGGRGNTGGKVPNGKDGWSVRFMFKEEGTLCAYLYYPDMIGLFGEKLFLESNSSLYILPKGQWVKIGLGVTMNALGEKNGSLRCYVNDQLMLEKSGLVFRKDERLKIDHLLFSVFFGGADSTYAPGKDCYLLFRDFIVTGV